MAEGQRIGKLSHNGKFGQNGKLGCQSDKRRHYDSPVRDHVIVH